MPKTYRTVFISDCHLGSRCQAGLLIDFIQNLSCERICLVGDIIDLLEMHRFPRWTPEASAVVQLLIDKARRGTEIVYIPGNHDEWFRRFPHMRLGEIEIVKEWIYESANGKTYLLTHGDEFDGVIKFNPVLKWIGGGLHTFITAVNDVYNRFRRLMKLPYLSLSVLIRKQIGQAGKYVALFENACVRKAQAYGVDGIVCGHIHHPNVRRIDGIEYMNCGDWVEHCTALTEDHAGNFSLVSAADPAFRAEDITIEEFETEEIVAA